MANQCDNHLMIKTSVSPDKFLTPVLDHTGTPTWDYTFECLEKICPFNNPSNPTDSFSFWWTKWVDCHDCTIEEWVIKAPAPDPNPLMFTVGTRRFPLYQGPPKKDYHYWEIDIWFTSAWWPPTNYLLYLYNFLRALDDRTDITLYYEEPGNNILGHWYNGLDFEEDPPTMYYSDLIDAEIMDKAHTEPPSSWLQFHDMEDIITPEEACMELSALGTPEADEEILQIKSHFSLS